ncbi:MAG: hypothetical protein M3257_05890 [Actinomycetota bacterium]|nr:hypothetical protein [Actinomycetota bacterium]
MSYGSACPRVATSASVLFHRSVLYCGLGSTRSFQVYPLSTGDLVGAVPAGAHVRGPLEFEVARIAVGPVQVLVTDDALAVLDLGGEPFREVALSCTGGEIVANGVFLMDTRGDASERLLVTAAAEACRHRAGLPGDPQQRLALRGRRTAHCGACGVSGGRLRAFFPLILTG